jgi:non-heme chloroperoxidase
MVFLGQRGYRVIAHDQRSHGRCDQTWDGKTMDQYADDLAELFDQLDLSDAVLVGHSTGGGEVAHYFGCYGTRRVTQAVLLGSVPPLMVRTETNPGGRPLAVFDGIRKGTFDNRAQFLKDLAVPFYGYNREGVTLSVGIHDPFWLQGMIGGLKGLLDCIREFSEVDCTEDLKKIDVPTWVVHGDDDQIIPIGASAVVQADPAGNPEDLSRRAAWPCADPSGHLQRGSPRVHQTLSGAFLHPLFAERRQYAINRRPRSCRFEHDRVFQCKEVRRAN